MLRGGVRQQPRRARLFPAAGARRAPAAADGADPAPGGCPPSTAPIVAAPGACRRMVGHAAPRSGWRALGLAAVLTVAAAACSGEGVRVRSAAAAERRWTAAGDGAGPRRPTQVRAGSPTRGRACRPTRGRACRPTRGRAWQTDAGPGVQTDAGRACRPTRGRACRPTRGPAHRPTRGRAHRPTRGRTHRPTAGPAHRRRRARRTDRRRAGGDRGPCTVGEVDGTCLDVADCTGANTPCPATARGRPRCSAACPTTRHRLGTVHRGEVDGACIDAAACTGANIPVPGHCPGPAEVQCCVPDDPGTDWGPCTVGEADGTCLDAAACTAPTPPCRPLPGAGRGAVLRARRRRLGTCSVTAPMASVSTPPCAPATGTACPATVRARPRCSAACPPMPAGTPATWTAPTASVSHALCTGDRHSVPGHCAGPTEVQCCLPTDAGWGTCSVDGTGGSACRPPTAPATSSRCRASAPGRRRSSAACRATGRRARHLHGRRLERRVPAARGLRQRRRERGRRLPGRAGHAVLRGRLRARVGAVQRGRRGRRVHGRPTTAATSGGTSTAGLCRGPRRSAAAPRRARPSPAIRRRAAAQRGPGRAALGRALPARHGPRRGLLHPEVRRPRSSEVLGGGATAPWSPYHHPDGRRLRAVSLEGAVPQGYIDGVSAALACDEAGARLCTDDEWLRACRGPAARSSRTADTRQGGVCNDRPLPAPGGGAVRRGRRPVLPPPGRVHQPAPERPGTHRLARRLRHRRGRLRHDGQPATSGRPTRPARSGAASTWTP